MSTLGHLGFWKDYWITMRPYLLFVSGVAGMVGFVSGVERGMATACGAFLVFFLSYGFGQALTDCFQMDTDAISSPYRPLIQGTISRKNVMAVSLIGLLGGCLILFLLNPLTLILGILCVGGLATYTYFKRRWWGGPFYNAWIVAFLPLMGRMATQRKATLDWIFSDSSIIVPVMLSVFFSYANFVLMGYFKDISADRASGYNTFVVRFGWMRASVASHVLAGLSIVFSAWAIREALIKSSHTSSSWISLAVFSGAVATLFLAQRGIHSTRGEKESYRPITCVVRAFILLHLAEILAIRPGWIIYGVPFYIGFEIVLKKRPVKSQV